MTIVGVGLIGASIGMALRARNLARQVVGVGRSRGSLSTARRMGAIDRWTLDLARGVGEADLVLFCTPVGLIAGQALAAAPHAPPRALFTDAGSTKQRIVSAVAAAEDRQGRLPGGARFVGSHPLAGSERSGPQAARDDLFLGRKVVVTPHASTRPDDLAAVRRLWESLGSEVLEMSPERHDRALSEISHLPHLIAAVLCRNTAEEFLPLAGGGWLDTTRIAAGDVTMWKQIVAANRENLSRSLDAFGESLSALSAAVRCGDDRELEKILQDARTKRDAVGN